MKRDKGGYLKLDLITIYLWMLSLCIGRTDMTKYYRNAGYQRQLSATEIFNKFDVSHPAISQHLKVLRDMKLVQVEKRVQQ